MTRKIGPRLVLLIVLAFGLSACSVDRAKKHYILGEKLWADGKYAEAVSEFNKVVRRNPKGPLGIQALYRAAMTQAVFLNQSVEAIDKFKKLSELNPSPKIRWTSELQIGELLYRKLVRYREAIQHYERLLKMRPDAPEKPMILYRMGRSHFFLWKFDEAIKIFQKVSQEFPKNEWGEKAKYQIGISYFTGGEQSPGGYGPGMKAYESAVQAYQDFIESYPKSRWVPEARFGIANCLEELDRLDEAYQAYQEVKETYPSPQVIQIKLIRIQERIAQKNQ